MSDHYLKLSFAVQFSISELCKRSPNPVLLTLTFHDNVTAKSEAETRFARLRERLRRIYPTLLGVGVWQRQTRGAWHLHLVLDRQIPVDWLRPAAVACGFGSFVNLKHIKPTNGFRDAGGVERVSRYVSRYVTRGFRSEEDGKARLVCYIRPKASRMCTCRFTWGGGLHKLFRAGRGNFYEIFGYLPTRDDWVLVVRLGWEMLDTVEQDKLLQESRAVRQWFLPDRYPPDPF